MNHESVLLWLTVEVFVVNLRCLACDQCITRSPQPVMEEERGVILCEVRCNERERFSL